MMQAVDKKTGMSEASKLSGLIEKHGTLLAISLIILTIFINGYFSGKWGVIGKDSDDALRLVQIKDYLAGQSWFHTDQYRMGPSGGTDMHWSRLPDIPIILLTHLFDIVMPQDRALIWAFTVWPPLSAAILIWSCFAAAKFWGGEKTKVFTFILLAIFLLTFFRFSPGAIDHHNLQLGFLAMSMGFALDKNLRFSSYFISGVAAAMAVAIGAEIYLFIAVICGFVALQWALAGRRAAAATQGFGLGFSCFVFLAFIGTVSPSEYGLVYCDALSRITVTAAISGGLGLAVIAGLSRRFGYDKHIGIRLIMLMALGVLCAAVLLGQAPQCLVNPLESLPTEVKSLWLENVSEARSIAQIDQDKFELIPFMLGAPIVAIVILILDLRKQLKELQRTSLKQDWRDFDFMMILPLVLIITALAQTFYQMRFYPFAYIFAIVPLAGWLSHIYTTSKAQNPASVIYLVALVAAVPAAWTVPGLLLDELNSEAPSSSLGKISANCSSPAVLENLQALPKGTISADSDMTGFILSKTHHRALSGNYHRNWKGISAEIRLSIAAPDLSKEILAAHDVDYVYYCAGAVGTQDYINHNENGLTALIARGESPKFLERVSSTNLEGGDVAIFKVK